MKPTLLLLVAIPLVRLAADTLQPGGPPPFTWVDPADPAVAAIRQTGEQLISRVDNLLIFEVENGIAENGIVKTLEAMHLKNLVLPKHLPGQPRVTAVKHTSLNLRNPANLPDAADRAALEKLATAIQGGEIVPAILLQRLEPAGAPVEWRVYRPLSAMPLCLKCHGPVAELQPEIREYLARHFPQDKATGYATYQWRGVVRISLAAAEPVKAR